MFETCREHTHTHSAIEGKKLGRLQKLSHLSRFSRSKCETLLETDPLVRFVLSIPSFLAFPSSPITETGGVRCGAPDNLYVGRQCARETRSRSGCTKIFCEIPGQLVKILQGTDTHKNEHESRNPFVEETK